MQAEPGDLLLFAADKNKVVWDVLGALRLELARQLELIEKDQYHFLWVTDFPLLEWSEEENRFMAMHHPFTMPVEEESSCPTLFLPRTLQSSKPVPVTASDLRHLAHPSSGRKRL